MRRALGNGALVLGGLLFALAAAEGAARLLWTPPTPAVPPPLPDAWRDLPRLTSMRELDRPGLRALYKGVLVETNSAGFRGPEVAREKPPDGLRIVVVGDSIPMGWGVRQEETYAARLERALAERAPGSRVEVLNFGLAGLDAPGAIDRLEQRALAFEPDLVVYGFTLNDLEGRSYRKSRRALAELRGLVESPSYLWRVLGPRLLGIVEVVLAPRGTYVYELDDNYFRNPEAWGRALEALDRLAAATREREICGVVLLHTRLHYLNVLHPYHRHYDAVRAAAEERGLFVVPSFEAFRGRKDRELWVREDDAHPGPEGHAILAETLLAGLAGLPSDCGLPPLWNPPPRD